MTPADVSYQTDPASAIAERQLAMLAKLAHTAMEVSQAYGAAAIAASHAVEVILADEYYQPETERARALAGAKDAADGFQKAARTLRLTLKLEMQTAEALRDFRAGVPSTTRPGRDAGETPAVLEMALHPVRRLSGGARSAGDRPDTDRCNSDYESLTEFDPPDRLPGGAFRESVDSLCADIGVAPDWNAWSLGTPDIKYQPLKPRPLGWSECHPDRNRLLQDPLEISEQPAPRVMSQREIRSG